MKSEKLKTVLYTGLLIFGVLFLLGGIGAFAQQLIMRSGWTNARHELADSFSRGYREGASLERGDECVPADRTALDLYYDFLINPNTVLIRSRDVEPGEQTIMLHLPDTVLYFTPCNGGDDTVVCWQTGDKQYSYQLHGHVSFEHLDRYFVAARYRAKQEE